MGVDTPIPKEIEDEVRTQLEPLFLDFYSGSKLYKAYYGYLEKFNERMLRATDLLRTVRRTEEGDKLEPKAETAFDVFLYLTQIELVGNGLVDMAILLLIAKGIEFHPEPDAKHPYTRHATLPRDLDSATLFVKLQFLKINGLSFFEKCIERDLRNDIAHADFEINDKGEFFRLTEKEEKKKVDVAQKFFCFSDYAEMVFKVLKEQTAKVTPSPKQSPNP